MFDDDIGAGDVDICGFAAVCDVFALGRCGDPSFVFVLIDLLAREYVCLAFRLVSASNLHSEHGCPENFQ